MSKPARGRLFIVSAPSGAGKTTLTRAAVERLNSEGLPCAISVSYTTRAPRTGEQEGVHYHFVPREMFDDMARRCEFLEHAEVYGRRYGTGRAATESLLQAGTQVVLDIDWQGGRQVRAAAPDAVSIFILPPSLEELGRRLRGRGQDSDAEVARRMAQAQSEMAHYKEYRHVLINTDFECALAALIGLIRSGGENPAESAQQSIIEKLLK